MSQFFDTAEARRTLEERVKEIPEIQKTLAAVERLARTMWGSGGSQQGWDAPHRETDPDFLGLMLAFSTPDGRRVDFIGINDPTAPTDTVEDFMALLKAAADARGDKRSIRRPRNTGPR